jgi:hypothetical protein
MLSQPQGHSAAGRIRSIEKSNDLIYVSSASISGKVDFKFGNQQQFKCDLEQNTLRNFSFESKVNIWKYVEIVQHNAESQIISFSHTSRLEHVNTQMTFFFRLVFSFSSRTNTVFSSSSHLNLSLPTVLQPLACCQFFSYSLFLYQILSHVPNTSNLSFWYLSQDQRYYIRIFSFVR